MISGKRHQDVYVKMDTLDAAHLAVKHFDVAISLFEAGAQYPWLLVLSLAMLLEMTPKLGHIPDESRSCC